MNNTIYFDSVVSIKEILLPFLKKHLETVGVGIS
jgi:hypothetical protein